MSQTLAVIGATGGIGSAIVAEARLRFPTAVIIALARQPQLPVADDVDSVQALDLADPHSVAAAAQALERHLGSIDRLIVASGRLHGLPEWGPEKKLEDLDPAVIQRVFTANTFGPMLVARRFLPLLTHRRPATLAFLAARVGSIGDNRLGGWYSYRASKAALVQFNRTLAHETRRRAPNLISVCLHPGTVNSALSAPFQQRLPDGQLTDPDVAAGNLWNVMENLKPEHHGHHLAWDGSVIPW